MQKQSCQKLCFFRIHAKWYFIPVGRDALIPPQRNLADCDKSCKWFVGDDAGIVPLPGLAVYSIIC